MTSHHCDGKLVDIITRNYAGNTAWNFRARTSAPGNTSATPHSSSAHTLSFNRPFWEQVDAWARNLDSYAGMYGQSGVQNITWFGEVGSMACHRSTWAHNRARGLDLTRVNFDPWHCDMNLGWRHSNIAQRRRYLAIAASLRRYFGTVLTGWYDQWHDDHIHFDNQLSVPALRTSKASDASLVQAACVNLNGESIAIDGQWGNATWSAYNRLLNTWDMQCLSPTSNASHAKTFLWFVAACSLKNQPASYYRYWC